MNVQDELKALKERIAELECHDKKQKFPQYGDEYWYVDDIGILWLSVFGKGELSNDRVEMGNVFRTKNEAVLAVEKLKVEAELRKYSRPFILGEENWYLNMVRSKDITIAYDHYNIHQGTVYFKSKDKVKEVIESVGEERIKKYIFGVEE